MRYMQHRWTELPLIGLFGADGEEDPPADPQVGAEPDDQTPPVEDKFSAEYVASLRKEAADRRVATKAEKERADALEAQLAELKKAEMSDLEAAKTDLEQAQAKIQAAEEAALSASTQLKSERIQNAVTMAAIEAGFVDPSDALSMISQDDLVDDEGNIDSKVVTKKLADLGKKKPYLLKKSRPGSSDGGPQGDAPATGTFEERQAAYLKEMTTTGGRIPA